MSSRNGGTVCTGFPDDIVQIPEGGGVFAPRCYTDKHNPGDAVCQKQATPYKNVRGDSGFYSRIFYEVKKGRESVYLPITFAVDSTEVCPILLNERVLSALLAAEIVKIDPRTKKASMNVVDNVSYEVKRTNASHNNANVIGHDVLKKSGLIVSYEDMSIYKTRGRPIFIVPSEITGAKQF